MKYRVTGRTSMLASPGGDKLRTLFGNTIVDGTGQTQGEFVGIRFEKQDGWVAKAKLVELEREDLDEEAFVRESIIAERSFNNLDTIAPWFVLADFIIARAIIETRPKLENAGKKFDDSDAGGPLQVSSAEWKRFLDSALPVAVGYDADDFDDYLKQVWGATFTMHADAKAISKVKRDAGLGSEDAQPLPSYLEIYLAYLTGSPKAAVALVAGTATAADMGQSDPASAVQPPGTDADTKLNEFLRTKGGMLDAEIAALFKRRATWTGTNDANAKTAGEFVRVVSDDLNKALREAFELIKKHAPESIVPPGGGPAPWFTVAQQEKAKGIDEKTAAGDARVKEYFQSIGMAAGGSTPWCAAFVSFCMTTCGNAAVVASVPKRGPALAANWQFWGEPLPVNPTSIPLGAVVVLIPTEKSDTSGHVGFYAGGDNKTVTLLGGNQSDRVKESTYSRSRVVAARWLNTTGAVGRPAGVAEIKEASVPAGRLDTAKLILSKFAAAGFGPIQQIAALANAIKESGLIADRRNKTDREDSVGLFQLNMLNGLGVGHAFEHLIVAENNIAIIIAEAKKFPSFGRATTLDSAVREFVVYVERPKDTEGAIAARVAVARSLAVTGAAGRAAEAVETG